MRFFVLYFDDNSYQARLLKKKYPAHDTKSFAAALVIDRELRIYAHHLIVTSAEGYAIWLPLDKDPCKTLLSKADISNLKDEARSWYVRRDQAEPEVGEDEGRPRRTTDWESLGMAPSLVAG